MSMSKQDFIALADTIKRMTLHDDGESLNYQGMLEDLADFCKSQNSKFMRDRWLGYIAGTNGKSGGKVKAA